MEVRQLSGGRFPAVSDGELTDFHTLISDAGLGVSGVSPGFFKGPLDEPGVDEQLGRSRCPGRANGPNDWGPTGCPVSPLNGRTRRVLRRLSWTGWDRWRTSRRGRDVAWRLKTRRSAGGQQAPRRPRCIRQVGEDRISLCWDPGNSARAGTGTPYPGEYTCT